MRKLWLTPALSLAAFFGSAAAAQEAPLPEASSAVVQQQISPQWQVKPDTKIDLSLPAPRYTARDDFNSYRLPPLPKDFDNKPGGFVGRAVTFFDDHSPKGDTMYDFAVEKQLGGGFSIIGGTVDMNNNTGHNGAIRQTVRAMTGLPDSQTRELRRAMSGGEPQTLRRSGGDGVAVGVRFHIGLK